MDDDFLLYVDLPIDVELDIDVTESRGDPRIVLRLGMKLFLDLKLVVRDNEGPLTALLKLLLRPKLGVALWKLLLGANLLVALLKLSLRPKLDVALLKLSLCPELDALLKLSRKLDKLNGILGTSMDFFFLLKKISRVYYNGQEQDQKVWR